MHSRRQFIHQIFSQAWSQGPTAIIEKEIDEVVFHHGGDRRRADGQGMRQVIEAWRDGFPDLTFEIEDLVEGNDRIAVRACLT